MSDFVSFLPPCPPRLNLLRMRMGHKQYTWWGRGRRWRQQACGRHSFPSLYVCKKKTSLRFAFSPLPTLLWLCVRDGLQWSGAQFFYAYVPSVIATELRCLGIGQALYAQSSNRQGATQCRLLVSRRQKVCLGFALLLHPGLFTKGRRGRR